MKRHNNNNESLNGTHHSPLIFLGLRRLLHSTITFPLTLSLNDTLKLTLILPLTLGLGLGLSSIFLTCAY